MESTRREFLKNVAVGGAAASVAGFALTPAFAQPGMIRTRFRPSVHGFHFSNEFSNEVIRSGPIDFTTQGRCGGMAALSLDYFFAGMPIPNIRYINQGLATYSGPAVCRWPDGTVHAFVIRYDGSIATKQTHNVTANGGAGVWNDWVMLDRHKFKGDPAACAWGQGRIDLFAPSGSSVSTTWCDGGAWADDHRPCGNYLNVPSMDGSEGISSIAAASPAANRVELYGVRNGGMLFRYYDNGWNPWSDMGAPTGKTLTSAPAAASQYGWMNAVVRASDNAVWQLEWRDGAWQPWRSIGGVVNSAPALASPFPGRLESYAVGTDGQMWMNIFGDGQWAGWVPIGAPPAGLYPTRPAALSATGYMDVYAFGKDNLLWHRQWSSNHWNPWALADQRPSAASDRLGTAIYNRLFQTTIDPLTRAGAAAAAVPLIGGIAGFAGLGSNQNWLTFAANSADQCWQWSYNDHLTRITNLLKDGKPVLIGLVNRSSPVGHQVVAWGLESGSGGVALNIYDNEYPDCDTAFLKFDPSDKTITESDGTVWKGVFARDDYSPQRPA
jgi:hypothetical protein